MQYEMLSTGDETFRAVMAFAMAFEARN